MYKNTDNSVNPICKKCLISMYDNRHEIQPKGNLYSRERKLIVLASAISTSNKSLISYNRQIDIINALFEYKYKTEIFNHVVITVPVRCITKKAVPIDIRSSIICINHVIKLIRNFNLNDVLLCGNSSNIQLEELFNNIRVTRTYSPLVMEHDLTMFEIFINKLYEWYEKD